MSLLVLATVALVGVFGLVLVMLLVFVVRRAGTAEPIDRGAQTSTAPTRRRVKEIASSPAVAGRASLEARLEGAAPHSVWLELGLDTPGGILSSGRVTLDVEARVRLGTTEHTRTLVIDHDGEETRVEPSPGPGLLAWKSSWPAGHVVESRRLFDLPGTPSGAPVEIAVMVRPRQALSRFDMRLWVGAAA